MENNLFKMKKLQELQPQMMAKSMEASTQQMKVMPVTMVFLLPMYAWVWYFINPADLGGGDYFGEGTATFLETGLSYAAVQIPWAADVFDLNTMLVGKDDRLQQALGGARPGGRGLREDLPRACCREKPYPG